MENPGFGVRAAGLRRGRGSDECFTEGHIWNGNTGVTSNLRSRGIRLGVASFLKSPWAAPVFLMPFVIMLAVHQLLGLSDALLVADIPGERPAHGYNLLLGINMNLCPVAAVLHLLNAQRTFRWIIARLLIPTMLFLFAILTL
jgi:hypothetical protein